MKASAMPGILRRMDRRGAIPTLAAMLVLLLPAAALAQGTTGSVQGTVTDRVTGEPIAGATVSLFRADGTATMVGAFTGADGGYALLNVPPGRYDLRTVMPRYRTLEVENVLVTIGVTTFQHFRLSRIPHTGVIEGTITDSATGEPIVAANVVLFGLDGTPTGAGAFTDGEGKFRIINAVAGRYNLRAAMVHYKAVAVENLLVTVGVTTTQNFRLEKVPPR